MGVAVKVTFVPVHAGLAEAAMLTEGAKVPLTTIVIVFEVAVNGFAQTTSEVISQTIISPFTGAALVKVGLFVPAFTPLSFH